MKSMQFSLAPQNLLQSINPWTFNFQNGSFGLVNINMGVTPKPEVEQDVLDTVGSYGRQLGWMGEALEVVMRHVDLSKLDEADRRTIDIFKGRLAEIGEIKKRHGVDAPARTG